MTACGHDSDDGDATFAAFQQSSAIFSSGLDTDLKTADEVTLTFRREEVPDVVSRVVR